jgi:hypothetical protein
MIVIPERHRRKPKSLIARNGERLARASPVLPSVCDWLQKDEIQVASRE